MPRVLNRAIVRTPTLSNSSTGPTSGHLREDFVAEDLMLLLMANAGVVAATNDAAPGSGARFVAYMLQAFASEAAKPLPPAPSPRRMYRAMMRVSSRGGSRRRVP